MIARHARPTRRSSWSYRGSDLIDSNSGVTLIQTWSTFYRECHFSEGFAGLWLFSRNETRKIGHAITYQFIGGDKHDRELYRW